MLKRMIRSITSVQSYSETLTLSKRSILAYVVVLALLVFAASYFPVVIGANRAANYGMNYLRELPDFRIEKGQLSVDHPMPMVLENVPGEQIVIVDTSGRISPADLERYYDRWVVIMSDRMVTRQSAMERRQFDFISIQEPFTKADLLSGAWLLARWKPVALAVLALCLLALSILGRYINGVVLAALGLAICRIQKTSLPFDHLYRLAVHAMTLPLVMTAVFSFAKEPLPYALPLFYTTALLYLWLAIRAITRERVQEQGLIASGEPGILDAE